MTPDLFLQRLNDSFLMKDFLDAGYEGENLSELNRCRMYLHATCLSDIVTEDGKSLASESLAGRRKDSRDLYYWPPQPPPKSKF